MTNSFRPTHHFTSEEILDSELFAVRDILTQFWKSYANHPQIAHAESSNIIFTIWWQGDPRLEILIETGDKANLVLLLEITRFVEQKTQSVLRLLDEAPEV